MKFILLAGILGMSLSFSANAGNLNCSGGEKTDPYKVEIYYYGGRMAYFESTKGQRTEIPAKFSCHKNRSLRKGNLHSILECDQRGKKKEYHLIVYQRLNRTEAVVYSTKSEQDLEEFMSIPCYPTPARNQKPLK